MKQELLVMNYLRQYGSISQKEATEKLGVTRLAAVIWQLKHKRGFEILDRWEFAKNRFGIEVRYKRWYLP